MLPSEGCYQAGQDSLWDTATLSELGGPERVVEDLKVKNRQECGTLQAVSPGPFVGLLRGGRDL